MRVVAQINRTFNSYPQHEEIVELQLLLILISAILVAVVIRADAVMLGPYFATSELIPGFPGFHAGLLTQRASLRWAVARRFLYPFLCGAALSLLGMSLSTIGITGGFAGFLLIWPAFFKAPPWGVSRRDWRYTVLNVSLIVGFTGLAMLGEIFVSLLGRFSEGDIWKYLADQAFSITFGGLATILGSAFVKGTYSSLQERAEQRIRSDQPNEQ